MKITDINTTEETSKSGSRQAEESRATRTVGFVRDGSSSVTIFANSGNGSS